MDRSLAVFDVDGTQADSLFTNERCELYFEAEFLSGTIVRSDTTKVHFDNLAPGAPGKPVGVAEE